MLLTVLGCSGSVPGPDAPASGYLLEAEGFRLMVDIGNGTLAALQAGYDPFTVDALLLSHLHPDHCADFSALTVLRRYHPSPAVDPRARPLPVHAPAEATDRLVAAFATCQAERDAEDLSDVYDFRPLAAGSRDVGPFRLQVWEVAHPCASFGFRIVHGGVALAYTGDTGRCAALDELAAGVDALLCEASWTDAPDHPAGLHLSGREAGELAGSAGVGRLLVTHVPPWVDRGAVLAEASENYPGAELVTQGARYRIG